MNFEGFFRSRHTSKRLNPGQLSTAPIRFLKASSRISPLSGPISISLNATKPSDIGASSYLHCIQRFERSRSDPWLEMLAADVLHDPESIAQPLEGETALSE